MPGIDALARAINEFEGGLVLVSHDMRLISQVAKEIWICDNKTITKYKGDILNFKMGKCFMKIQLSGRHSCCLLWHPTQSMYLVPISLIRHEKGD